MDRCLGWALHNSRAFTIYIDPSVNDTTEFAVLQSYVCGCV